MELAKFVKGHHVFRSESRPGDSFTCAREPSNTHSSDAIIVKLSDGSNVGHVPDPLARVLAPMPVIPKGSVSNRVPNEY